MFFDEDLALSSSHGNTTKEFTGVLLIGPGHLLYPCTDDASLSKGLLPIANRPMMEWAMTWLEDAGIKDLLVITLASSLDKVNHYLRNVYEGTLNCTVEATEDDLGLRQPLGTAQLLARFRDRITKDFIVLSCDTIVTIPPEHILNYHRCHDPLMTVVYSDDRIALGSSGVGTSEGDTEESKTFVGTAAERTGKGRRLVHTIDVEDCVDDLKLRTSLLWKFPKVNFSTHLEDGHLYIMKRYLLDLFTMPTHSHQPPVNSGLDSLKSLREDFIPFLVKCQYQTKLATKYGVDRVLKGHPGLRSLHSRIGSPDHSKTPSGLMTPEPGAYQNGDIGILSPHPRADLSRSEASQDFSESIKCMIYINPSEEHICSRANTLVRYANLNRWALKTMTSDQSRLSSSCQLSPSALVGSDSILGDSSRIEDRSSIKKSCVGSHVVVGKYTKIISSIVMDHVVIEDGCKLENCILGQGARVMEKTTLKNCEVAPGYTVPKETNAKEEKMVRFGE